MERFATDPLADARVTFAHNTWAAIKAFLPFGSGVGTFPVVYPSFEQPTDLATFYVNRAHNDVLETLLEAGLASALLMAWFALWLLSALFMAWRGSATSLAHLDHTHPMDDRLRRAAATALLLLALHSIVDYPLRTGAIMVVAAFCCALLAPALVADRRRHSERASHREPATVARQRSAPELTPAAKPVLWPHDPRLTNPDVSATGKRWQSANDWPEEWKSRPAAASRPSATGTATPPPHTPRDSENPDS